jgi:hypothetical protein
VDLAAAGRCHPAPPRPAVGCRPRLPRLGVHDRRGRLPITAQPHPQPATQPLGQALRQAPLTPPLEERVHRLPGREIHRQRPPLDTVARHVPDPIEHRPQIMHHRPARGPADLVHHCPSLRLQHPPLPIGHVRRVARHAVTTQATRTGGTGARRAGRVDRHPRALGPKGWLDTSQLPRVLAYHREHGVPEEVSRPGRAADVSHPAARGPSYSGA